MKSLLEEAIEAWEDARNGVIAEVENIPANRFEFRPTPDNRTVSELVRHIMEVSLMMVGEWRPSCAMPWPTPTGNPSAQPKAGLWQLAQDCAELIERRVSK